MIDQQSVLDSIFALAIEISTSPTGTKFVDAHYDGVANQLQLSIISRKTHQRDTRAIDLHEPGEPEIARERVLRLLREQLAHLQSIYSMSTRPQQRRLWK